MSNTETIQVQRSPVTEQQLWEALSAADGDGDGLLNGPNDHLPQIRLSQNDRKILLADPVIQDWYRVLRGHTTRQQSLALRQMPLCVICPEKKILHPKEIAWLMKQNGGHLLRLGDVAQLYPNAKIRGRGPTLSELAAEKIYTQAYAKGVPLAEAYLDPGGDLIVSQFYRRELREHAPAFTQFMTNQRGIHPNAACHDPKQAFITKDCHPDSWPVDIDTLLSMASLHIAPVQSTGLVDPQTARRKRWIQRLSKVANLHAVSGDAERGLNINLRTDEYAKDDLRQVLKALDTIDPRLHCDPDDRLEMAYHLGVPLAKVPDPPTDVAFRKVLLAIFDHPETALSYYNVNKAAEAPLTEDTYPFPYRYNRQAKKPSLHFLARIPPTDIKRVIFVVEHIDAQSYKPRGTTWRKIMGPTETQPQHQGEIEPIYLTFRRKDSSTELTAEEVYLGDHFVAEPVGVNAYDGEIATAYGSGGHTLREDDIAFKPGMMFRSGMRSRSVSTASTQFFSAFDYVEVYPGFAETQGAHPTAARFAPDTGYHVIIEGDNGDFIPTGRLLTKNGLSDPDTSDALNTAGYPFVRGSLAPSNTSNKNRLDVSLDDYLTRQDEFYDNRLMGSVVHLNLTLSNTGDITGPPLTDAGTRVSLRLEQPGTMLLGSLGPVLWGGSLYLLWPTGLVTMPWVPQMNVDFFHYPKADMDDRFKVDLDVVAFRAFLDHHGLSGYARGRAGLNVAGSFQDSKDLKPGYFGEAGAGIAYQRLWIESRLGLDVYCSSNQTTFLPDASTLATPCAVFTGVTVGTRFRLSD